MAINKRSGKTSAASRNKYNDKAYDRLSIFVPSGKRDIIRGAASKHGLSINGYVTQAIDNSLAADGVLDNNT